jgi:hypothetical protein
MRSGGGGADARSCVVAVAVRGGLLPSELAVSAAALMPKSITGTGPARRGRLPRRSRRAQLRPSAAAVGGFAAGETGADAPAGERRRGDGDEKKGEKF